MATAAKTQAPTIKIPACASQFSADQIALLAAPLELSRVSERQGSGTQKLAYLEGWDVINHANHVFGFDGWDRETVEMVETWNGERNGKPTICFRCKVKITVHVGSRVIVREGTGYGDGMDRDLGKASELATKEAETDATKRAFMTFGNGFGLALYDKSRENVVDTPQEPTAAAPAPQEPAPRTPPREPARTPPAPPKEAPARETQHKAAESRAISETPEDRTPPADDVDQRPPQERATPKPAQGEALAKSRAAASWKCFVIPAPDAGDIDDWNKWTERLEKGIELAPSRDKAIALCTLNAKLLDGAGDVLGADIKRWAYGRITKYHGAAPAAGKGA